MMITMLMMNRKQKRSDFNFISCKQHQFAIRGISLCCTSYSRYSVAFFYCFAKDYCCGDCCCGCCCLFVRCRLNFLWWVAISRLDRRMMWEWMQKVCAVLQCIRNQFEILHVSGINLHRQRPHTHTIGTNEILPTTKDWSNRTKIHRNLPAILTPFLTDSIECSI